jgi:hypothetical protein
MSDPAAVPTPAPAPPPEPKRGWFVVLAWVTFIGLAIFTGALTYWAATIPALKAKAAERHR